MNDGSLDAVDTIDVTEYAANRFNQGDTGANPYDKTLCQDNKQFTIFLNKCILLDQTVEMETIIQKVLLPAYVCADDEYKRSEKFNRVIRKAIQRLIDEPWKKYSHISDVTETLKFHVKKAPKKRVEFVTLSTTTVLGKSYEEKRKRAIVDNKSKKNIKKLKLDVIAVDSEDDDDLVTVDDKENEFEHDNDVIAVDDKAQKTKVDDGEVKTKKNHVNDDLFVEDQAKIMDLDRDLITVSDKTKKRKSNDDMVVTLKSQVNDDIIAIDDKYSEINDDNSLKTTKQKLKIYEHGNPIKFKGSLKLKKAKDKLATIVKPDAVSSNGASIKIKDSPKFKESENKYSSTVENNNNTPIEVHDSEEINIDEEMQIDNNERNISNDSRNLDDNGEIKHNKENLDFCETLSDSNNKLLVPLEIMHVENKEILSELNNTECERIKVIEAEILKYKKKIADLEVAEVTEDSSVSAYVRCDRLQAHIVKLYKELCTLVKQEPVKGRQVRLLPLKEGQPEGPLRRLERFLNKQVDEDGVAPFPDFADVVRCVEMSNVQDGLGWSKGKVHKEAQALFEYCGRALQKRRQRREWKHLRSYSAPEAFDADPAASDPELLAKLELNRQVALRKEADILEKFTRMETIPGAVSTQHDVDDTQEINEGCASSNDEEQSPNSGPVMPMSQDNELIQNKVELDNELVIRIKEEPYEVPIENMFKGDISIVIEISDSDSSDGEDSFGMNEDF